MADGLEKPTRRRWDSNPRSLAGHTISSRADSAALALLLGAMRRYSVSHALGGERSGRVLRNGAP